MRWTGLAVTCLAMAAYLCFLSGCGGGGGQPFLGLQKAPPEPVNQAADAVVKAAMIGASGIGPDGPLSEAQYQALCELMLQYMAPVSYYLGLPQQPVAALEIKNALSADPEISVPARTKLGEVAKQLAQVPQGAATPQDVLEGASRGTDSLLNLIYAVATGLGVGGVAAPWLIKVKRAKDAAMGALQTTVDNLETAANTGQIPISFFEAQSAALKDNQIAKDLIDDLRPAGSPDRVNGVAPPTAAPAQPAAPATPAAA